MNFVYSLKEIKLIREAILVPKYKNGILVQDQCKKKPPLVHTQKGLKRNHHKTFSIFLFRLEICLNKIILI